MNKYKAEEHRRCIDPDFEDALCKGGLKELLELVKNDSELLLCFRSSYINIYYKGHSLLRIEQQKTGYKASFNIAHARFTAEPDCIKSKLTELNVIFNSLYPKPPGYVYIKIGKKEENTEEFWGQIIANYKAYMDDFFSTDPDKKYDYFKSETPERAKRQNLEKQVQHKIITANAKLSSANDYFIFDMEYTQPRNSGVEIDSGRFDMLALRLTENNKLALVFIELKSTKSACAGKTGLKTHLQDLKKYLSDEKIVAIRRDDAIAVLRLYQKLLNFPTIDKQLAELIESREDLFDNDEILFIFTDDAEKEGEKFEVCEKGCEKIVFHNSDNFCLSQQDKK